MTRSRQQRLQVNGPDIAVDEGTEELSAVPSDPKDEGSILDLVSEWLAQSYALNATSRSPGNQDLYPFVLASTIGDKLRFAHQVVGEGVTVGLQSQSQSQS